MLYKPEHTMALLKWLQKPTGTSLLKLECQEVNLIAANILGYDAVIIGEAEFAVCLQQCPIKHKYIVNVGGGLRAAPGSKPAAAPGSKPVAASGSSDSGEYLCSRQDRLAIASESVDLVYIAHSLEYSNNPYEVLLEAYRILRPDGHLLVSMFNPFSLLGIWRQIAKWAPNSAWRANFMSTLKLKDWLGLLGFDIIRVNHFGYHLSEKPLFEKYAKSLKIPFGAAYVVEASKNIIALTPIKPVWSSETEIVNNDLTEPTT